MRRHLPRYSPRLQLTSALLAGLAAASCSDVGDKLVDDETNTRPRDEASSAAPADQRPTQSAQSAHIPAASLQIPVDASKERVKFIRDVQKTIEDRRARFGNWSPVLDAELRDAADGQRTPVRIEFRLPYRKGSHPSGKLNDAEGREQRRAAFDEGISALRDAAVIAGQMPTFRDDAAVELNATRASLMKLRHDARINAIASPVANARHAVRAQRSLFSQFYFPSYGGVNVMPLCSSNPESGPQFCGQGATVGVLEPSGIPASAESAYFNSSWFSNRGGTPLGEPSGPPAYDLHGAWVSGIIRNSYGTDLSQYEQGGSRGLSRLLFGYLTAADADENTGSEGPFYRRLMMGAYDWMVYEQGARIVNHSWMVERYVHPDANAQANVYDRHLDIATANWPYVFNVMGAGNAGRPGTSGNEECLERTASSPSPWTAEECARVGWWGHNGLIVGGALGTTLAHDSSYANGPRGDEAPHVMGAFAPIQLPWMQPYYDGGVCGEGEPGTQLCGTSFAAPTVTSLAANLVGRFSELSMYPEALRAILIASATRWPLEGQSGWSSSDYEDGRAGAGLPNGYVAMQIALRTPGSYHGYRTHSVWPDALSENMPHETIEITSNVATRLHVYLTWVSDFSNMLPGSDYPADDFDLVVYGPNGAVASSSWKKTTEHVVLDLPAGSSSFEYHVSQYSRVSNPDASVYLAVAWAPEVD